MLTYTVREIEVEEIPLLKDFLYEAIFQKDENNLLPYDIVDEPSINVYIENFGKKDDACLVAEVGGKIVGAVWTRILCGDIKGYGNIDEHTPEFAISLYNEYRNKGIGTQLMKNMLLLLKNKGYKQTSLSVQKDNYAVGMYIKIGFTILRETDEEYIMVFKFQ